MKRSIMFSEYWVSEPKRFIMLSQKFRTSEFGFSSTSSKPSRISGGDMTTSEETASISFHKLVILNGRGFVRRNQLRLETRALPVAAIMFADVEGAHIDDPLGLVECIGAGNIFSSGRLSVFH